MCFIREWNTGLGQRKVALMLSQKTNGAVGTATPRSVRTLHIQASSEAVLATALYSASVDERTTPFCFLELHEMGCFPRYTM